MEGTNQPGMDRLKNYAKTVEAMRKAQREYFKARRAKLQAVGNEWYNRARDLEKEVDKLTIEILADSVQSGLFS